MARLSGEPSVEKAGVRSLPRRGAVNQHAFDLDPILEAAAGVFVREGFGGATVDQLAAEARTAKRTIYARFGDKAGLFSAVVRRLSDRVVTEVPEALDPERPFTEELEAFLVRLLTVALSREALGVYRLVVGEAGRFPELAAAFYENGPGRGVGALAQAFEQRARQVGSTTIPAAVLADHVFNLALGEQHRRALMGLSEQQTDDAIRARARQAVAAARRIAPALLP